MFNGCLRVKGNTTVAADRHRYGECNQFLGLGVNSTTCSCCLRHSREGFGDFGAAQTDLLDRAGQFAGHCGPVLVHGEGSFLF